MSRTDQVTNSQHISRAIFSRGIQVRKKVAFSSKTLIWRSLSCFDQRPLVKAGNPHPILEASEVITISVAGGWIGLPFTRLMLVIHHWSSSRAWGSRRTVPWYDPLFNATCWIKQLCRCPKCKGANHTAGRQDSRKPWSWARRRSEIGFSFRRDLHRSSTLATFVWDR